MSELKNTDVRFSVSVMVISTLFSETRNSVLCFVFLSVDFVLGSCLLDSVSESNLSAQ